MNTLQRDGAVTQTSCLRLAHAHILTVKGSDDLGGQQCLELQDIRVGLAEISIDIARDDIG